ncbi:MAG: peptide-methionine (S)-S-oxide reductase MsrA [Promethearchaeota archaeon]
MHIEEANEIATLGGGCFWCLEPIFDDVQGVIKVESGYSGGHVVNPSYEMVCTGTTGHAEVVQVTFNPTIISFKEILEIFFEIHDPTTLNRQGNDIGSQYRSAIFYHSSKQKETAEKVIKELEASKVWKNAIVTEVTPFDVFYRAEEYHQKYFKKNPYQGYCRAIIAPKVNKFHKKNSFKLKIST